MDELQGARNAAFCFPESPGTKGWVLLSWARRDSGAGAAPARSGPGAGEEGPESPPLPPHCMSSAVLSWAAPFLSWALPGAVDAQLSPPRWRLSESSCH